MQLFKLIAPVVAAFFISVIVLSGTVLFFADAKDKNTLVAERNILSNALEKLPYNAEILAEDHAWWDESVNNTILTENPHWQDTTIGDTVRIRRDLDGVYILRADNSLIYQEPPSHNITGPHALLENGLAEAIANLKITDQDIGISSSGFIVIDDRLFAVAISMVKPSNNQVYDPPISNVRGPVVVLYREITSQILLDIARDINLKKPVFSPEKGSINSRLIITDINGNAAGEVRWQTAQPGFILLRKLLLPAVIFLLVILAATAHFVRGAMILIENLKQADQAKMSFLASMSHEVRTPLNAILGFSEMISLEIFGKIEGEKNKEYLKIIRQSGEHLLTIINDILDISKLESGRFEVYAETMDPTEVINECLRLIEIPANDKSIEIALSTMKAKIKSDERIIRQILINIFSNAVKFTPKKGRISIVGEKFSGGYLITITDNGIGMTDDQVKEALEPFGQIRQANKQSIKGTGLGLPLVDRFMRLVGGQMMIRSVPGKGTTVSLVFPGILEEKYPETSYFTLPVKA
jgi:signal transduction histidine kinase